MHMAVVIARAACVGVLMSSAMIRVDERYAQGDIGRGAVWRWRVGLIVMWLFLCMTMGV